MPGSPVSVTARAVSSIGTMPVHFRLVEGVLFFVMGCLWSRLDALYGFDFSGPARWFAGPGGRPAGSSAATEGFDRGRPGRTVMVLLSLEAAGGDVAVAGGGADVEFGGAVVLEGIADAAVTGAGVQGGRDAGGGADRDVAHLGVEDNRAARGLGDPDAAPGGADLPGAAQSADLHIAVDRGEADARDLVDLDLPIGAFEGDVAEAADAAQLAGGGLGLYVGAGGQLDGHFQGSGGAEVLVLGLGGVDPQGAVGEFDCRLLGRLQVAALGWVGGQHLDGGVGPVGGDDLDAPGGDVQDGGDRGGGVELLPPTGRAPRATGA